MLTSILTIPIPLIVGFILRRYGVVKENHRTILMRIIFYFFLPITIFRAIGRSNIKMEFFFILITGSLVCIFCFLTSYYISRNLDRKRRAVFVFGSSAMNLGLFIYPFYINLGYEDYLARVILFDIGQVIVVFTFLYSFALKIGTNLSGNKRIIKKLLFFPPLWGLISGLTVSFIIGYEALLPYDLPLYYIYAMTSPGIMLCLGTFIDLGEIPLNDIVKGTAMRFIISPLYASIISFILLSDFTSRVIVFSCAAVPPAMLTLLLAGEEKLDTKFASTFIGISIIIAMIFTSILFIFFIK